LNPVGLNPKKDLTGFGSQNALVLNLIGFDATTNFNWTIYTDASNYVTYEWTISGNGGSFISNNNVIPFWALTSGTGTINWKSIGAIVMYMKLLSSSNYIIGPISTGVTVTPTVNSTQFTDVNNNGIINPGNQIRQCTRVTAASSIVNFCYDLWNGILVERMILY
jgi:hypothetical protein